MMMIIEPAMAVRLPAGAAAPSSTIVPYFRSMWSTDDVNGVKQVATCRLVVSHGFDIPWATSQNSTATPFKRRNKLVKNRIWASTKYLGSAHDPVKPNGRPSYHPFEEISELTSENIGDARLTAAETSRTIIEVNDKATLMFSSLISNEVHENIFWPDLPYLTDDCGNIYFQVKNGEDILQSLTSENNLVQVIVGVKSMDMINEMDLSGPSEIDFGIEEINDQDSDDVDGNDEEDDDEYVNDDNDLEWVAVLSDKDEQDDDDETFADWAKLETMSSSHPMYFAKTLAEIASDDPIDWMEQPPACLVIQGLVRPAFIEEHPITQKHLSTNQFSDNNIGKPIENKGEDLAVVNGHVHNSGLSRDNATQVENTESSGITVSETSFYKLEMIKIQLFSAHEHPTNLEVEDYMKAQPDAIAHTASKILNHMKSGGEKTLQALKSLCWRCKGIPVEEAQLICIDSLGFDLRVCSGTQVQTLRFAFMKRATSEYSAERQLNDLLFPRIHQKPQKMKQTQQNEC